MPTLKMLSLNQATARKLLTLNQACKKLDRSYWTLIELCHNRKVKPVAILDEIGRPGLYTQTQIASLRPSEISQAKADRISSTLRKTLRSRTRARSSSKGSLSPRGR